jgi:hypothetical protein
LASDSGRRKTVRPSAHSRLYSSSLPRSDHPFDVRAGDWALTAAAVVLVRVLALGIPFSP